MLAGRLPVLPTAQATSEVGNCVKEAVAQEGVLPVALGSAEESAEDIVRGCCWVRWGVLCVLMFGGKYGVWLLLQ